MSEHDEIKALATNAIKTGLSRLAVDRDVLAMAQAGEISIRMGMEALKALALISPIEIAAESKLTPGTGAVPPHKSK